MAVALQSAMLGARHGRRKEKVVTKLSLVAGAALLLTGIGFVVVPLGGALEQFALRKPGRNASTAAAT